MCVCAQRKAGGAEGEHEEHSRLAGPIQEGCVGFSVFSFLHFGADGRNLIDRLGQQLKNVH